MSLAALGTLNQRTGEQQHMTLQSGDSGFLKGMWGRALGKDYSETVQSQALGDISTEGRLGGLQAGVDLYRAVAASGSRTSIGVFGGHLWSSTSDVSHAGFARSAGTTNSDGWTLGGYVTHVAASGWYVDAVVQRDWLDHRANGADGTAAATQSRSTLASLEVGKAFGSQWKFEPQAQIIYGDTRIDAFADSGGIANRIEVEDNIIGRGGFRLKRTWDYDENSDGGLFTVYAKANIWGRLDGGASALTVGASQPGIAQMREVWGDVGFGTTFSLARNAEFFSEFDVEYGIDQGGTALAGRGGLRLRF
jgi:outer membrane autotransporter protein